MVLEHKRIWSTNVYRLEYFNDFVRGEIKDETIKRVIVNRQSGSSWLNTIVVLLLDELKLITGWDFYEIFLPLFDCLRTVLLLFFLKLALEKKMVAARSVQNLINESEEKDRLEEKKRSGGEELKKSGGGE